MVGKSLPGLLSIEIPRVIGLSPWIKKKRGNRYS